MKHQHIWVFDNESLVYCHNGCGKDYEQEKWNYISNLRKGSSVINDYPVPAILVRTIEKELK
jgi:hypothetical protein